MIENYSFILPVFNQGRKIQKNLIILDNKLKAIKNINYEIITVDDGSSDSTFLGLKSAKQKISKIKILKNSKNFGKGYTVRQGVKRVNNKTQHIIIMDSDLPYFNKIELFLSELKKNKLVIINRKHKNSRLDYRQKNLYSLARHFSGGIFNLIIRLIGLTSLKDTQAGLKGFSIQYKNFINMTQTNGFLYDLELMIIFERFNIKPKSIPCTYAISKNSSLQFYKFNLLKKIVFDLFKITYLFYSGKYNKI